MGIYSLITEAKIRKKKLFALLVDPGKLDENKLKKFIAGAVKAKVDFFFVGGSLLTSDSFENCIRTIKNESSLPAVIFPGNGMQISHKADAILFLSLISGRNAEMLIGQHVIAAPYLKVSPLEVISAGYMLVESGRPTAVSYMSNTTPIPHDKDDIAVCTAMAGEMLGLKLIFLDGGSGALNPVSTKMIAAISGSIGIPLIVGGGISTPEKALENCRAGADVIVTGNSAEKDPSLVLRLAEAVHSL